jgi:hypothetical protein
MAEWALVENNEIKEIRSSLPRNWRNISGLNLSSDKVEWLASLGWIKITKNHQEYNSETHEITEYHHSFQNDQVVETITVAQKPPPAKPSPSQITDPVQGILKQLNTAIVDRLDRLEGTTKIAIYSRVENDTPTRLADETEEEYFFRTLRWKRNILLKESDWTQMPDVQISDNDRRLWREYRQKLRDLVALYESDNPPNTEPPWPTPPGA